MREFILRESVLNDNTLLLADSGKVFKGGFIAYVLEYTYQNAWSNKEHVKRFRSEKQLQKYLSKNYTKSELEHVEL